MCSKNPGLTEVGGSFIPAEPEFQSWGYISAILLLHLLPAPNTSNLLPRISLCTQLCPLWCDGSVVPLTAPLNNAGLLKQD